MGESKRTNKVFRNLFKMLMWKNEMQKHAHWFDKNEPAQARFEENEEWQRIKERYIGIRLSSMQELHEFEAYLN